VNLTFENASESALPHSVDFQAAAGPGGGAEATMTAPGETNHLRFKTTCPGAYIYHCAVPNMEMHISAGLFGIILVDPEGGIPEVNHELYLGQHEIDTNGDVGQDGKHSFDMAAMRNEDPTYVVMNGEKYATTPDVHGSAATVSTGDTARVYFITGGPNLTSGVHPIGNIREKFWPQGSLTTEPQTHIRTSPVAPGSACIATMNLPVPGQFNPVDHALSRVTRRGCLAIVTAAGGKRPDAFDPDPGVDGDGPETATG
jgi:nitrite reductase (NO-forming)